MTAYLLASTFGRRSRWVLRVSCSEHWVRSVDAHWARHDGSLVLTFEQAPLALGREILARTAGRLMPIADKLFRDIVHHYIEKAVAAMCGPYAQLGEPGVDSWKASVKCRQRS